MVWQLDMLIIREIIILKLRALSNRTRGTLGSCGGGRFRLFMEVKIEQHYTTSTLLPLCGI
jgi:hypothetical protein